MENKKSSLLMKIHAVLLVIDLAWVIRELVTTLFPNNLDYNSFLTVFSEGLQSYDLIVIVTDLLTISALAFSLIYLIKEYKKSAHISYKIFLCIYLFILVLETVSAFAHADASIISKILFVLVLIVLSILTFVKNLGKKNSKLLAVGLIVLTILITLVIAIQFVNLGYPSSIIVHIVFGYLLYVLLSLTAYVMVTGKYIDKESRGAK